MNKTFIFKLLYHQSLKSTLTCLMPSSSLKLEAAKFEFRAYRHLDSALDKSADVSFIRTEHKNNESIILTEASYVHLLFVQISVTKAEVLLIKYFTIIPNLSKH